MSEFDAEMQRALEADGEKLRQLTGEDHGPHYGDGPYGDGHWCTHHPDDPAHGPECYEPETFMAPCPVCFESCGYVVEFGNDWESGPWSHQTNIPCRECNGTGVVPSDAPGEPDDREDEFSDPGYLKALAGAL